VTATLISGTVSGNLVTASCVIYNGGQKSVTVSSLASFDAKDGEGAKGKFKFSTHGSQLDGRLVPGDTLVGDVTWEFASPPTGVKVYYTDSLFVGDTLAWSVE
jgi:hypothetical protein